MRERLLPYGIRLVDVDLRWGVSAGRDVSTVCKRAIDGCRPWFLAILGDRYGWVPDGQNLSITEQEIRYAAFNPRRRFARPVFLFRDPGVIADIPEDFRHLYSEGSDSNGASGEGERSSVSRSLAALKNTIEAAGHKVCSYSASWSPGSGTLTGLDNFGRQVEDALWREIISEPALEQRFAAGPRSPSANPLPDDIFDGATVLDPWIGRRRRLLAMLRSFVADGKGVFLLQGPAGSGKTTSLLAFSREIQGTDGLVFTYFPGLGSSGFEIKDFLWRLCQTLDGTSPSPADTAVLAARVRRLLVDAASERKVLVVVDGIGDLPATDGVTATDWIPNTTVDGLAIILSARDEGPPVRMPRPEEWFTLEPLDRAEAGQLVRHALEEYGKAIDEQQLGAMLGKDEAASALYLSLAAEHLRIAGRYNSLDEQIEALPGTVEALLVWTLREILAKEPGFRDRNGTWIASPLVEEFAALLSASRIGLSAAELRDLIEQDEETGNVAAMLRLVRTWLVETHGVLAFRHPRIEATLRGFAINVADAAHIKLADYFRVLLDRSESQYRDRAISELPFHLLHARRSEELWDLVRSPHYLANAETHPEGSQIASRALLWAHEAACREAPDKIAEFTMRRAHHLHNSEPQDPLLLVGKGHADVGKLLDAAAVNGNDGLWTLLIASELLHNDRVDEAAGMLRKLLSADLTQFDPDTRWAAFPLLVDAWIADPPTADHLTRQVLDDRTRAQLAIHLVRRQLPGPAATVCALIELDHDRWDSFQSLAENLVLWGGDDEAKPIFRMLSEQVRGSVEAEINEYVGN